MLEQYSDYLTRPPDVPEAKVERTQLAIEGPQSNLVVNTELHACDGDRSSGSDWQLTERLQPSAMRSVSVSLCCNSVLGNVFVPQSRCDVEPPCERGPWSSFAVLTLRHRGLIVMASSIAYCVRASPPPVSCVTVLERSGRSTTFAVRITRCTDS